MIKLQGLIVTSRSLFGGRRPTFGFVVLPFVGVVLFLSLASCRSCVVPYPCHLMDLGQGSRLEGAACFEFFKARSFCYISHPLFSRSPTFYFSLSCGFCLDWVFANCNFLRYRERLC